MRHILYPSLYLIIIAISITPIHSQDDHTLRRARVPILMYHYIGELPPDADIYRQNLTVSTELFRQHMQYLSEAGYTTISLYDLDAALNDGHPLPPKPIVLTFDDGHLDHYTNAFPILQEQNMTGTFFIVTSFIDAQNPAYLSWEQVQEMAAAGMNMEAHTKSHPDLRNRNIEFLTYEIAGSLESIEAHTGHAPRIFSYPGGRYDANVLTFIQTTPIIRAVTTEFGNMHTSQNALVTPRLRVSNDTSVAGLAYLLEVTP